MNKSKSKCGPTARGDVHHPVHSASRGITGKAQFTRVCVMVSKCLPSELPILVQKSNLKTKQILLIW